jgi:hypothetical protein
MYKINMTKIKKRIMESNLNRDQINYIYGCVSEIEKTSDQQAKENEDKILEAISIAKSCI